MRPTSRSTSNLNKVIMLTKIKKNIMKHYWTTNLCYNFIVTIMKTNQLKYNSRITLTNSISFALINTFFCSFVPRNGNKFVYVASRSCSLPLNPKWHHAKKKSKKKPNPNGTYNVTRLDGAKTLLQITWIIHHIYTEEDRMSEREREGKKQRRKKWTEKTTWLKWNVIQKEKKGLNNS